MAKKFLTNLDLSQNQLLNAVVHNNPTAPENPVEGQLWMDTTADALKYYDGKNWISASDAPVTDVQVNGTTVVSGKVANITLGSFGVTASKDELNVLDGITATTAELNYVDGVTSNIQTQLNAKQASLSETQMAAVNSGITASKVSGYDSHVADNDIHVTSAEKTAWTAKYDKPTGGIPSSDMTSAVQSSLTKADSALQASDITTGSANGTVSVKGTDVSVKGLGSAAYTDSTAYDASGAAATAETNAKSYTDTKIQGLDGKITGSASASQTLTSFSETDGVVTATFGDIAIANTQVSGLGTASTKDFTTSVTEGSDDLVTSGAVQSAISALPTPMVFKGSLGDGGTITDLPTASSSTIGHTYKVISDGTYGGIHAKTGDIFVCNDKPEWVLIPAGDDPSGTVTSVGANEGLTTSISGNPITTSGYIQHAVPTGAAATNAGLYKVSTDKFGHVTSATAVVKEDITGLGIPAQDTNTTYTLAQDGSDGHKLTFTPSTGTATVITIPDNDTTYTAGTALGLSGTTFNHSNIGTAGTYGSKTDTSGTSITIPYVTTDAQGHVSAAGTITHTVSGFGNAKKVVKDASFSASSSATVEVTDATSAWATVQVYTTSGDEVIMDVNQTYADGKITITLGAGKALTGTYKVVIIYS